MGQNHQTYFDAKMNWLGDANIGAFILARFVGETAKHLPNLVDNPKGINQ